MAVARTLERKDLEALAKHVAEKSPIDDDEAKLVLDLTQAADNQLVNVILANEAIIVRVLKEIGIELKRNDGVTVEEGMLQNDDIADNIKQNDLTKKLTKTSLAPHRDLLLKKWIESRRVLTAALLAEAKAMNNGEIINANDQPYGVQIQQEAFGNLLNKPNARAYLPLKEAAQNTIVAILEAKIKAVDSLHLLNQVMAQGKPIKEDAIVPRELGVALDALYNNLGQNEVALIEGTLSPKQLQDLVDFARVRANQLVKEKLQATPGAINVNHGGDEAKNAYLALLAINHAGIKAALTADNIRDLKLGALNPDHVGALDEKIYSNASFKDDAQKALADFMVKIIKDHATAFDREEKIQALRNALNKATPIERAAAINALEPFATWGHGQVPETLLRAADITRALEVALKEALDAKSQFLIDERNRLDREQKERDEKQAREQKERDEKQARERKEQDDKQARAEKEQKFADKIDGLLIKQDEQFLRDFLKAQKEHIVEKLKDIRYIDTTEFKKSITNLLKHSDSLSAQQALIDLGVPNSEDLKDIAQQIARNNQEKEKKAVTSNPEIKKEVEGIYGRSLGWGLVADHSTVFKVTSEAWTMMCPENFDGNAGVKLLKGAQGIGAVFGTGVVAFAAGTYAAASVAVYAVLVKPLTYTYSSAKQYAGVRDFKEFEYTMARLQHRIEEAKGSRNPVIEAELNEALQRELVRLEKIKAAYQYDKQSRIFGKIDKKIANNRYERLETACDVHIQKIRELKTQLAELDMAPNEYRFKTKVEVVNDIKAANFEAEIKRLYDDGLAALPGAPGMGDEKERLAHSVRKEDFNDVNKAVLMKVDTPGINSCALSMQRHDGTAETRLLTVNPADGKATVTNPYAGMDRNDWRVIMWAVEMTTIHLKKAKNKNSLVLYPGTTDATKLTPEQIAAVFIYCARMHIKCGPKDLFDVTDKEMKIEKAEQLKTIKQYYADRKTDSEFKRTDMTKEKLDERVDELADRSKYFGPEDMDKVLEKGADVTAATLRAGPK